MIKHVSQRLVINKYAFFTSLKDRYKREKVFHLLDQAGSPIKDYGKKLELTKQLVIMRSEIDGNYKVGIQTIKSYLDFLSIYDIYLQKYKRVEKADQILYQSIEEKCKDVDLIKQATLSSRFFYYLNGGDYQLLCHELQCHILVRKLNSNDAQNKIEEAAYIGLLKDAVDEYVEYVNKYYRNSESVLLKVILAQEEYHIRQAQLYYNQDNYQAALDEIVSAQTQMNEFWSNCSQKEEIRIIYQAKLINKIITLGRIKCKINLSEGFQIIKDAFQMYEESIGIDDTYQELFLDIVQFLRSLDENTCLLFLEGIYRFPQNQLRLQLEWLRVSLLFPKGQLKQSELDQMIETYRMLEANNQDPFYQYLIFIAFLKNSFNDKKAVFKLLEEGLIKLQLLSLTDQSTSIINIVNQMMLNNLQQDYKALETIRLSIQILDNSCYRLNDNFSQLKYDEQVNTISTERDLIFLQFYQDKHKGTKSQNQQPRYEETFNRIYYLESLFQSNRILKLPILEILNNIQVEDKDVVEKVQVIRQNILDVEVLK